MSDVVGPHDPSPQFRAGLERAIRSTYREISRSPETLARFPVRGRIRTAAVIALAFVAGFAGNMLAAQIQENRLGQVVLATERAELELATMRSQLARRNLEEVRGRFDVGIVGGHALAEAEAELQAMEALVARIRLNIEEIENTGRPPRDDLTAPLVAGRDFASERLELELNTAHRRLTAVEKLLAERESLHRVMRIAELPVLEVRADLARARTELERLARLRDLRQRFLQRSLSAEAIALELTFVELGAELRATEQLHELAEARLSLLRTQHSIGRAQQVEVLRAEVAVAELASEMEKIRLNLQQLERPAP